ncbi:alpha/beta fold hydrolase [Paraburkholderia aspalathi]|nr:alpha/beta fold hydrolase [Paraburkholderia aspalathi]
MPRLFAFLAVLLIVAGCGGPRAVIGLDSQNALGKGPEAIVPMFVATTRERSDNLSLPYSARRSPTLNFAKFDIGIPQNHVPGEVEKTGRVPDPARHFTARSYQQLANRLQLVEKLNVALMQRPAANREIFIFVHGYNNNFADSIFRNAQIVHDYNISAVPLHFAWASGGSLPLYVFDRDSALVARGGLAETLEIAAQTKATGIVLVGHSMGAYVVMEALRDLAITGRGHVLKRLRGVVLAAPDIDVDVFQSQVRDMKVLPRPFTIIVSRRDRALSLSRRIAGGHPRVGSGSDIAMLQAKDITVLDASDIDGGAHNVFASSQALIDLVSHSELMRIMLTEDQPTPSETMLADGSSVFEGAAALVVYLPKRILGGLMMAGMPR